MKYKLFINGGYNRVVETDDADEFVEEYVCINKGYDVCEKSKEINIYVDVLDMVQSILHRMKKNERQEESSKVKIVGVNARAWDFNDKTVDFDVSFELETDDSEESLMKVAQFQKDIQVLINEKYS